MEDVAGEDRRACFLAEVPDVGAADLDGRRVVFHEDGLRRAARQGLEAECAGAGEGVEHARLRQAAVSLGAEPAAHQDIERSEEHTSELQSLMRISYAVFCLKKKNTQQY